MKIRNVLNGSMLLVGILAFFGSVKAQGGAVPTSKSVDGIIVTSPNRDAAGRPINASPSPIGITKVATDASSDLNMSFRIPSDSTAALPLGNGIGKPAPLSPPSIPVVHLNEPRVLTEQDKANAAESMEEYHRMKASHPTKEGVQLRVPQPNDATDPKNRSNQ